MALKEIRPGYLISDMGEVWSLRGKAPKKLSLHTCGNSPYLRVSLREYGNTVPHSVHKLVLEAFVGPRPKGAVARHMDGDLLNNSVGNLRWGSQKENIHDKWEHGTMLKGESHHQAKLTKEQVFLIRSSHRADTEWAKEFGVCPRTVGRARKGLTWRHI